MTTVTKHWKLLVLGLIVSLAAIYFVIHQVNVTALAAALRQAQYIYVLPAIALIVVGLLARAIRWRVLLSGGLTLTRSFSIINITYLLNGLLPFRLGELARAWLASRGEHSVPIFTSFSTIIVERLLDTLAVLVIIGIALAVAPLPPELRTIAAAFLPLVIIGFVVLIVLASNSGRTLRLAERLLPERLKARWDVVGWIRSFLAGLKPLTRIGALTAALLWTAIAWGLSLASGYVLMIAFFGSGSWAATCLFTAAASFAVAVPAVPGNVGPYEASIILALQALGYAGAGLYETAVAFAIVVHGLNLAVVAVLGVVGFIQEGISLEQLSQGVRGIQQENAAG